MHLIVIWLVTQMICLFLQSDNHFKLDFNLNLDIFFLNSFKVYKGLQDIIAGLSANSKFQLKCAKYCLFFSATLYFGGIFCPTFRMLALRAYRFICLQIISRAAAHPVTFITIY